MALSSLLQASIALALLTAPVFGSRDAGAAAVDPGGDLEHVRPLLKQTLETEKSGIEIRWSNPETGHSGKIRVERTFFRDEQPCREYLRTISRPGASGFVIRGTACRTGRAVWTIEDEVAVETEARKAAARPAAPASTRPGTAAEPERAESGGGNAETAPSKADSARAGGAETGPGQVEPEAEPADDPFVSFTLPSRSPI
jgi:surface antigen